MLPIATRAEQCYFCWCPYYFWLDVTFFYAPENCVTNVISSLQHNAYKCCVPFGVDHRILDFVNLVKSVYFVSVTPAPRIALLWFYQTPIICILLPMPQESCPLRSIISSHHRKINGWRSRSHHYVKSNPITRRCCCPNDSRQSVQNPFTPFAQIALLHKSVSSRLGPENIIQIITSLPERAQSIIRYTIYAQTHINSPIIIKCVHQRESFGRCPTKYACALLLSLYVRNSYTSWIRAHTRQRRKESNVSTMRHGSFELLLSVYNFFRRYDQRFVELMRACVVFLYLSVCRAGRSFGRVVFFRRVSRVEAYLYVHVRLCSVA